MSRGRTRRSCRPLPTMILFWVLMTPALLCGAPQGPEEDLPPGVKSSDWVVGSLYLRPILAVRDAGYDSWLEGWVDVMAS